MLIQNIRRGFATNSSSSHSLLLINKFIPQPDVTPDQVREDFNNAFHSWGTLKSELRTLGGKLAYGVMSLAENEVRLELHLYVGDYGDVVDRNDPKSQPLSEYLYDKYAHLFQELTLEDFKTAINKESLHTYETGYEQNVYFTLRKETPEEFVARLRDPLTWIEYHD